MTDALEAQDRIDVDQLNRLQAEFRKQDDGLSEEQFIDVFHRLVSDQISTHQLTHLFLQVDVNADGRVDWTEFTDFLFLKNKDHLSAAQAIQARYGRGKTLDLADESMIATCIGRQHDTGDHTIQATPAMVLQDLKEMVDQSHETSGDPTSTMAVFKASGLATMEGLQLTTLCSYLGLLNPFDETARTGTRFIRPEEIDVEPTPVSDVLTSSGIADMSRRALATVTDMPGSSFSRKIALRVPYSRAHNSGITHLYLIEELMRVVSAGDDGVLCFWDFDSTGEMTFRTSLHLKHVIVAGIHYMEKSHRLLVAGVQGGIHVLSFSAVSSSISRVGYIPSNVLQHASPCCLHGFVDRQTSKEVAMIGTDTGQVVELRFDSYWKADVEEAGGGINGVTGTFYDIHKDWISQIRYLPDLNAVVITCTNGAVQVLDRDMERLINSYQEATPIYQLAWSKQSHLLAFSGASRDVTLWNPYSRRKQGSLTGHSAPVAGVEFDDVDARVITLAKDLSVRVWDLRSMRCMQIFRDTYRDVRTDLGWAPTMAFHIGSQTLITGTKTLTVWKLQRAAGAKGVVQPAASEAHQGDKSETTNTADGMHMGLADKPVQRQVDPLTFGLSKSRKPISVALFTATYNQAISVEASTDNVFIWDVLTGNLVSKFTAGKKLQLPWMRSREEQSKLDVQDVSTYENHRADAGSKDKGSVMAVAFDREHRRLFTGSSLGDGLHSWNPNNGQLLRSFYKPPLGTSVKKLVEKQEEQVLVQAGLPPSLFKRPTDEQLSTTQGRALARARGQFRARLRFANRMEAAESTTRAQPDLPVSDAATHSIDEASMKLNPSTDDLSNDSFMLNDDSLANAAAMPGGSPRVQQRTLREVTANASPGRKDAERLMFAAPPSVYTRRGAEAVIEAIAAGAGTGLSTKAQSSISNQLTQADEQFIVTARDQVQSKLPVARRSQRQQQADLAALGAEMSSVVTFERVIPPASGQTAATVQKFVCAASFDGSVAVFDDDMNRDSLKLPRFVLPSESDRAQGNIHRDQVLAIEFLPPNSMLSAGADGVIRQWSLNTGSHERVFYRVPTAANAASRSQIARRLSVESLYESTLDLDLIAAQSADPDKRGTRPVITCIRWSKTMCRLIVGSEDGLLRAIAKNDPRDELQFKTRLGPGHYITAISCKTDGSLLLTASSDGMCELWDVLPPATATKEAARAPVDSDPSQHKTLPYAVVAVDTDLYSTPSQSPSLQSRGNKASTGSPLKGSPSRGGSVEPDALEDEDSGPFFQQKTARVHKVPGFDTGRLLPICRWRGHAKKITSIEFVITGVSDESFVLSSSLDGRMCLWTISGHLVGVFGQGSNWDLNQPSTFKQDPATAPSNWVGMKDAVDTFEGYSIVALPPQQRALMDSSTTSNVSNGNASAGAASKSRVVDRMFRWAVPEPGQVWVKLTHDGSSGSAPLPDPSVAVLYSRSRRDSTSSVTFGARASKMQRQFAEDDEAAAGLRSKPTQAAAGSSGPDKVVFDVSRLKQMLTVVRVTKDAVIGFDGLQPPQQTTDLAMTPSAAGRSLDNSNMLLIPLEEFTSRDVRATDSWVEYPALSARVGHIFRVQLTEQELQRRKEKRARIEHLRYIQQQQALEAKRAKEEALRLKAAQEGFQVKYAEETVNPPWQSYINSAATAAQTELDLASHPTNSATSLMHRHADHGQQTAMLAVNTAHSAFRSGVGASTPSSPSKGSPRPNPPPPAGSKQPDFKLKSLPDLQLGRRTSQRRRRLQAHMASHQSRTAEAQAIAAAQGSVPGMAVRPAPLAVTEELSLVDTRMDALRTLEQRLSEPFRVKYVLLERGSGQDSLSEEEEEAEDAAILAGQVPAQVNHRFLVVGTNGRVFQMPALIGPECTLAIPGVDTADADAATVDQGPGSSQRGKPLQDDDLAAADGVLRAPFNPVDETGPRTLACMIPFRHRQSVLLFLRDEKLRRKASVFTCTLLQDTTVRPTIRPGLTVSEEHLIKASYRYHEAQMQGDAPEPLDVTTLAGLSRIEMVMRLPTALMRPFTVGKHLCIRYDEDVDEDQEMERRRAGPDIDSIVKAQKERAQIAANLRNSGFTAAQVGSSMASTATTRRSSGMQRRTVTFGSGSRAALQLPNAHPLAASATVVGIHSPVRQNLVRRFHSSVQTTPIRPHPPARRGSAGDESAESPSSLAQRRSPIQAEAQLVQAESGRNVTATENGRASKMNELRGSNRATPVKIYKLAKRESEDCKHSDTDADDSTRPPSRPKDGIHPPSSPLGTRRAQAEELRSDSEFSGAAPDTLSLSLADRGFVGAARLPGMLVGSPAKFVTSDSGAVARPRGRPGKAGSWGGGRTRSGLHPGTMGSGSTRSARGHAAEFTELLASTPIKGGWSWRAEFQRGTDGRLDQRSTHDVRHVPAMNAHELLASLGRHQQ